MSTKTSAPTTPKARKPKLWYKSGEIAHVWANEGAPEGKCSRSAWFEGTAFYSYATTIARIMHTKKGKRVYVRDHNSFSSNTGKTQGKLWNAIPREAIQFSAGDGRRGQSLNYTPESLRDYYVAEFNLTEPKKMAHEIAAMTLRRYRALDEAIRVCEVFGLPKKELCATLRRGKTDVEEASEVCRLHEEKKAERRKHLYATKQNRTIQRAIVYAETYLADPELIRYDGSQSLLSEHRPELWAQVEPVIRERSAGAIKAWQDGTTNEADYSWPAMLRREDNEIVTSKGARVPITDAKRAYRFAIKVKARGWRRNGEQFKVGMYDLDSIGKSGIVAGCHRISWFECHRFAAQQGW